MAGGGVVALGGAVLMLAGVGQHEKLSVSFVEGAPSSGDLSLRLLPGGLSGTF